MATNKVGLSLYISSHVVGSGISITNRITLNVFEIEDTLTTRLANGAGTAACINFGKISVVSFSHSF